MYKKFISKPSQTTNLYVVRIADDAHIPFDPANTDYQAYLEWVAEGNQPEEAD